MSFKSALATALLSILYSSLPQVSFAHDGGSHGGGGSGIVLANGDVRFVDLMTEAEIFSAKSQALGFKDVVDVFYKPNQYVRQAATEDKAFFACATEVLNAHSADFPVFKKLVASLPRVEVLEVQFPIVTTEDGPAYERLALKYPIVSTASNRLPADRQQALATYVNGQLWIAARLQSKMRTEDRCGLSVHESLRHLNFANMIETPLSQDEIETATRFLMGDEPRATLQNVIAQKLSRPKATTTDYDVQAELAYQAAKDGLRKLLALGPKPDDATAAQKWEIEASRYQDQVNRASAAQSHLSAKAILSGLDAPEIKSVLSTGLVDRARIYGGLTTPLNGSKRWDLIRFKIVDRP